MKHPALYTVEVGQFSTKLAIWANVESRKNCGKSVGGGVVVVCRAEVLKFLPANDLDHLFSITFYRLPNKIIVMRI